MSSSLEVPQQPLWDKCYANMKVAAMPQTAGCCYRPETTLTCRGGIFVVTTLLVVTLAYVGFDSKSEGVRQRRGTKQGHKKAHQHCHIRRVGHCVCEVPRQVVVALHAMRAWD